MVTSPAETYLIAAVQRGDADAWRELIDRYQGRLLSFARRMLARRGDAEDLVQETFLGLLRSLPGYDPARSLETYLFAILRHKLHDQLRRQDKDAAQSLEPLAGGPPPAACVDADTPSRRAAVREASAAQRAALVDGLRRWVDKCCTQQRFQELIVIEMLTVLGLRNKEVAEDLGLGETAVAGIKFRVLEEWRRQAQAAAGAQDWQEADLARDSTLAQVWREEGISCPKRSTLGRYLLGALDEGWNFFIDFHVHQAGCDRCNANLDDLRAEDARDAAAHTQLRDRCFASSIGFLSQRPAPPP